MENDAQLLRHYVQDRDENTFTALVGLRLTLRNKAKKGIYRM